MNSKLPFIFSILAILFAGSLCAQVEFVENKGQWDSRVGFRGDFQTGSFFTEAKGFTVLLHNAEDLQRLSEIVHGHKEGTEQPVFNNQPVTIHSHAYKVNFLGAADNPVAIPDKMLSTYNNYFQGDDKSKWASNCRIYQAITYKNIYPGIDVRYYSDAGKMKYDLIVHPGADPNRIAMKFDGVTSLGVKSKELVIGTTVGEVKELYPYSYQFQKEGRKTIECKYDVKDNIVRFKTKDVDPTATLVIDPTLIFSTFTGSSIDNWGFTATPGPDGSFFAGGIAFGSGYPVSPGAYQGGFGGGVNEDQSGPYDIAIFKFSANGSNRLYATYLGGASNEQPHSMICDAQGNLTVAGRSNSSNYPKTIPQIGAGGNYDIVVTKFNAAGSAIIGSLKIGGTGNDGVNIKPKYSNIAPDGAIDTRRNYGDDARSEVILAPGGDILVASCTQSTLFPVSGTGIQTTFGGGLQDGVVLRFTPNLTGVVFSTFFGGSGNDACFVLSTNPVTGDLYVGGGTTSNNLQGSTSGTINNSYQGGVTDGFVTQLRSDGSAIVRTTYIGTAGDDQVYGLQFDKFGFPYIMGTTTGAWPLVNAAFNNNGGKQFICKLQPDLSNYVYSTVFGTNSSVPNISPVAFLVDRCENVYVSGWGGQANTSKQYPSAGTTGLPVTTSLISGFNGDGSDFYFFVLEKNAQSQLFGSLFGQQGGFGDHVDGGTSRFDANGIIYQAMCANCGGPIGAFPTTAGVWSVNNGSSNCNQAAVKIEMNFAGVGASIRTSINNVDYDTTGCVPLTVSFTDTLAKGKRYIWDFGDGSGPVTTIAPNNSTSHTYLSVGRFRVRLISIDSSTCNISDTAYLIIKVGDNAAVPNFTGTKVPPCTNLTYQFTNNSTAVVPLFNANSFIWDFGDGSPRIRAGLNPPVFHTYPSPGTYKVRLIVDDTTFCNSPDSIEKTIRINPTVKADFTTPANGCVPHRAVFSNTSLAGTDFFWDFGDPSSGVNNFSTLPDPVHVYNNVGTYIVKMIAVDTSTCNKIDSTTFTITVHPIPVAGFTWSPNPPLENTFIQFTNQSFGAVRYLWDFGDGEQSTDVNPRHLFNKTDTFNTCLVAINAAGCADTICNDVPTLIKPLLDVPNAFTPGRFGVNGIVKVAGFGIGKMDWKIYNRWGQLVFYTTNRQQGWDGKFKGELQPMDVYTYTLDVEFTDGKKLRKTGDITLLR